jgi:hypothetical protein
MSALKWFLSMTSSVFISNMYMVLEVGRFTVLSTFHVNQWEFVMEKPIFCWWSLNLSVQQAPKHCFSELLRMHFFSVSIFCCKNIWYALC